MVQPTIADVVRAAAEQQEKAAAEKVLEIHIKLLTAGYDKSAAYTNGVVVVGYAAFFGLWTLTKQYLDRDLALWAALLILTSATVFVFFEVYKMVFTQGVLQPQQQLLRRGLPGASATALLRELQRMGTVAETKLSTLMRLWYVVMVVTVTSALGGVGIIGYAFVAALLRGEVLQPL